MTLEPLFSMASSTCPAGNRTFDTSHLSSVAVTVTTCSPSSAPLFSVHPVDGGQGRGGGYGGDEGESGGSHAGSKGWPKVRVTGLAGKVRLA